MLASCDRLLVLIVLPLYASLSMPACLVYLQISDEHTLREQGFTQDCNIHVHFSLYGGIKALYFAQF